MTLREQISDWKEYIADGFRGRPDVDLAEYATSRGLDHRGQKAQAGYVAAFPMTDELQFNVLRGALPGGEEGILYHEVKLHDADETSGTFYGHKVGGDMKARDLLTVVPLVGETHRYFKAPYTVAAIRLPQASGPLVGLDVGRSRERVMDADPPGSGGMKVGFSLTLGRKAREKEKAAPISSGPQAWAGFTLDHLGAPGWRAAWRGRAQQDVVDEILGGPITQLLATERPLGFRVEFAYGTLVLTQQHFLKVSDELDYHAQTASWLAGAIRTICRRHTQPLPFEAELPPPDWAAQIAANPDNSFLGLDSQDLGKAAAVGAERGLVSEDPFAFHRGFGDLPVPGEAIGVFRGTLPGTSLTGRLVTAIERPLRPPPPDWDRVLDTLPHGAFGCDSVLFPVRPGAPDANSDVGAVWGGNSRYALRRGVFVGWRARSSPHTDGGELDALAAEAAAFAASEGLLP
jgi:hypothetical protein